MGVTSTCEDPKVDKKDPPVNESKVDIGAATTDEAPHNATVATTTEHEEYSMMQTIFAKVGYLPAYYPWLCLLGSFTVIILLTVCRFTVMEVENRPDKQWVAQDAVSLDHKAYADATWPSTTKYELWIAKCKGAGCNIFDAKYIKALDNINSEILGVKVDGEKVRTDDFPKVANGDWDPQFGGMWSYQGNTTDATKHKCIKRGPACGQMSILDAFANNSTKIQSLTDASAITDINTWNAGPGNELKAVASAGASGPITTPSLKAQAYFGYYVLAEDPLLIKGKDEDPVADEWEKQALCKLGINSDTKSSLTCPEDPDLEFTALFGRSLSDTFGATIRGDVAGLSMSYVVIMIYLLISLSRRDTVHSMMGMSAVALIIVGGSFMACTGLGAVFGLPDNQLNNNIPFLLLGLGVDDAFVLSGEFFRAWQKRVEGSETAIEDAIISSCVHGGMSILITSATDAVAFLIGSITVLPALSWFCSFAGIGIIFCFLFQIFIFLPCLTINAKRAESNRFDCLCCCTASTQHKYEEPQGCCCSTCCSKQNMGADLLQGWLRRFGEVLVTMPGVVVTMIIFLAMLATGIVGTTQLKADFKLEWFAPDDSYVNMFSSWNDQYFASGSKFSVYTQDIDYFANQAKMVELHTYLTTSQYMDKVEPIKDFHHAFLNYTASSANSASLTGGVFTDKTVYYSQLNSWIHTAGSRYSGDVKWKDANCASSSSGVWSVCSPGDGITAAKMSATVSLAYTTNGGDRYDTMTSMRNSVKGIIPTAFPYSPAWIYWEEAGVIGEEFTRNLVIAGLAVVIMVAGLIPHPRVAICVIISVVSSITTIVGMLHWWDVTVSGISSIYVVISIGLAVDYSAHIGHMFATSSGTGPERSVKALERIGPSVLNAIISTLLAVIVLAFSKSYIFRVFFKVLCLTVLIGGSHGMLFLPALLSVIGGGKDTSGTVSTVVHTDEKAQGEIELPEMNNGSSDAVPPKAP